MDHSPPSEARKQTMLRPAAMLFGLTPNSRRSYVAAKSALGTAVLEYSGDRNGELQAWWRCLLAKKLLFHRLLDPIERKVVGEARTAHAMPSSLVMLRPSPTRARGAAPPPPRNAWPRMAPGPDRTMAGWRALWC